MKSLNATFFGILFLCLFFIGPVQAQERNRCKCTSMLSEEAQDWVCNLSQKRVEKLIRYEEEAQRREHWNTVTKVGVVRMELATKIVNKNPVEILGWEYPVKKNSMPWVWAPIEMPKNMEVPFVVQIQWLYEGNLYYLKSVSITARSSYYRIRDQQRMSKAGKWAIQIVFKNKVIAKNSFTVK